MSLQALRAYSEAHNQEDDTELPKAIQEPVSPVLAANMDLNEKRHELYKKTAENIIKSELLRSKITKSMQARVDHGSVLMDALECIYLMTGDNVFYEQNKMLIKLP